jgi:hypothetical protein
MSTKHMTNMHWVIYADNVIIDFNRLLAMIPTDDHSVVLLFDGGQRLTVPKTAASLVIDALRQFEGPTERNGVTCLPQSM